MVTFGRGSAALVLMSAWAASCAHDSGQSHSDRQVYQSDDVRLRPQWQALDTNHDGTLTLAELDPVRKGMLQGNDFDGDGTISLSEFVASDVDVGNAARVPLLDNVSLIADVPFAETRDPRQRLDIYLPKKATVSGPLPVIAYIHGGGFSVGSKLMARHEVLKLVDSGRYAAVSLGYRLTWQAPWPAQIHDVKAGIRWVRGNAGKYRFDPNRICAMGGSAGGHLASMLGLTNGDPALEGAVGRYRDRSSSVQCAIDMFGSSDKRGDSGSPLFVGTPAERAKAATAASPIVHVDRSDVPFYILHGTKDPLVPYQASVDLDRALRTAGVPVFFQTVEGAGHGFFGAARPEIERRFTLFLERNFYNPATEVPTGTLHP